jgi:hypothetical protein
MGEEKDKTKTKVEVKTAVYKVHVHCGQCARDIQTQFTEFQGACVLDPVVWYTSICLSSGACHAEYICRARMTFPATLCSENGHVDRQGLKR